MKIAIVTEGGLRFGFGHLIRCTAIFAEAIRRKTPCQIFAQCDDLGTISSVAPAVKNINWHNSIANLIDRLDKDSILIIDSYIISREDCETLNDYFQQVIFIDDNARLKYPVDATILNPNLFASEAMYPLHNKSKLWLGAPYVLLRAPFQNVQRKSISFELSNIAIMLGGTNLDRSIRELFTVIPRKLPASSIVAVGTIEHNNTVGKHIQTFKSLSALQMKNIMEKADIVISGGGQTTFELARVGTPSILVEIAENQRRNIDWWKHSCLFSYAGKLADPHLNDNILNCIDSLKKHKRRQQISHDLQTIIDGRGPSRILNNIYNEK